MTKLADKIDDFLDKKTLLLEIDEVSITEKGIPYFYYPINFSEVKKIEIECFQQLVRNIRRAISKKIPGVDTAIILSLPFFKEIMHIYSQYLLINKAERDGYVLVPSVNLLPETSNILLQLREGGGIHKGIRSNRLFPINYRKRIIAVSSRKIIFDKKIKEKIIYCKFNKWFHTPPKNQVKCSAENDAVIMEMVYAIEQIWIKYHADFPQKIKQYCLMLLQEAFSFVDYYWQLLSQQPKKITRRLWVDSTDNIWGRILARYVRKQGGQVTRWDQEFNYGYLANSYQQICQDFEDCDTYITIAEKQVAALRDSYIEDQMVQEVPPQFIAFPPSKSYFPKKKKYALQKKSAITRPVIMYLSTVNSSKDLVLLDFQVRLLEKLRSWNFNIILKYHSFLQNIPKVPVAIEHLFGPIVTTLPLEKLYNKVDIFLFDNLHSSLLKQFIVLPHTCIYLDFQKFILSSEAEQLLARRCPIVKIWQDEHHRAQIDWFALRQAVLKSRQTDDQSFLQYFFGG